MIYENHLPVDLPFIVALHRCARSLDTDRQKRLWLCCTRVPGVSAFNLILCTGGQIGHSGHDYSYIKEPSSNKMTGSSATWTHSIV